MCRRFGLRSLGLRLGLVGSRSRASRGWDDMVSDLFSCWFLAGKVGRCRDDCERVWVSRFERMGDLRSACGLNCACGVWWYMRCQSGFCLELWEIWSMEYNVRSYFKMIS